MLVSRIDHDAPDGSLRRSRRILRLFGLNALAVTNAYAFFARSQSLQKIRWEDFSDLQFLILANIIEITKSRSIRIGVVNRRAIVCRGFNKDEDGSFRRETVATLTFETEIEMVEFVLHRSLRKLKKVDMITTVWVAYPPAHRAASTKHEEEKR